MHVELCCSCVCVFVFVCVCYKCKVWRVLELSHVWSDLLHVQYNNIVRYPLNFKPDIVTRIYMYVDIEIACKLPITALYIK